MDNTSITMYVVGAIVAYFLGAIPFGVLIARAKGVDLRTVGSGNIGATNVKRALGSKWGYITYSLDMGKGFLPVCFLAPFLAKQGNINSEFMAILIGVFTVLGHSWSCYIGFSGGKGVATGSGVFFALHPLGAFFALVSWAIIWKASGYVSLASMLASVVLAVAICVIEGLTPTALFSIGVSALVIIRHRENIKRLLNGTESRREKKSQSEEVKSEEVQ